MKRLLIGLILLAFVVGNVSSHSGRTDKNGGHNCSEKSKRKGLCTGYHYHYAPDFSDDGSVVITKTKVEEHGHSHVKKSDG